MVNVYKGKGDALTLGGIDGCLLVEVLNICGSERTEQRRFKEVW